MTGVFIEVLIEIDQFLCVHKFTPLAALQGETGWLLPKYRHYLRDLQFWNRLVNMSETRLTHDVFFILSPKECCI